MPTGNTTEPWKDSNHPLFLHHSDQPGAVLVSQPLVEDNYTTWIESMMMALTIKNKAGFVTGSLPKPTDKPTEELQWQRYDVLVKTWLLGSMSKDIAKSVIHCKTARGIWLEIHERFSHSNIVSLFNVENQIQECVQGPDSVSTYFTKLKALWDEKDKLTTIRPCTRDAAHDFLDFINNQKSMKFLMGLGSEYDQVRGRIIGAEPFPEPNKVYSMVLRHEKQAKISNIPAPPDASAFSVKRNRPPSTGGDTKYCSKCNLTNHNTQQCRAHLQCTFCNFKGHTVEYCRKKKRTLEKKPSPSGVHNTAQHSLATAMAPPMAPADYNQVMDLLRRMRLNKLTPQQPSGDHDSTSHASANQVGNASSSQLFSGSYNGEDDWDCS